jgi:pimeloyl-ACP methyl ester carboxylesterase
VRAELNTLTLLASVLDVPVVAPLMRLLTGEPRAESAVVAGVPVEILRPAGRGLLPGVVFANGAHPLRRREPLVQRFTRGLARAGHLVVVPDLPGLGEGEITLATLEALLRVVRVAAERDDVRGGRVTLVGASTGASLSLVAAARPESAPYVSGVIAVAPFDDLGKIVCLATTRCYPEAGGFVSYPVEAFERRIIARSLVAALPPEDRAHLRDVLDRADADNVDPLDRLTARDDITPSARTVLALLMNRDPARYEGLSAELAPGVRDAILALSPSAAASRIAVPVEIIVPPHDAYFPRFEALSLARQLPTAHLTVTATLDHTRPRLSVKNLADFREFLRCVVRSVALAGGLA